MQPQDPNAPNDSSTSKPTPAAAPPTPPQPAAGASQPAPASSTGGTPTHDTPLLPSTASAAKKKKLPMLIILGVAGLVVVGLVLFMVMKMMGGNVKLERFSNSNLSVLVPVGYTKTEENGGGTFKEKEGDKNTQSEVVAFYEKLPEGLTQDDLKQVKDSLKSLLQNAAETSASEEDEEIKNIKITDITFKGDEALKLTADAMKDGKKVGTYTLVAAVNSKAVYLVGVGAHESDKALAKKVDEILNSLELK